jgi:diadenosine tetraphosphate (Ap4A) HIT family hydrolase
MKYSDYLKNLHEHKQDNEHPCPFCGADVQKARAIVDRPTAYLTYSVAPYHPDHLLVIPKRHIEHILNITDTETKDIDFLQKKALQILTKLGYTNMSILVKEGDVKEKTIAHTHYHIIPDVVLGDTDHTGNDRVLLTEAEIAQLLSKMRLI